MHVDAVHRQIETLKAGLHPNHERFVNFGQTDLCHCQRVSIQRTANNRDRSHKQVTGRCPGHPRSKDVRHQLQAVRFGKRRQVDSQRRGSVTGHREFRAVTVPSSSNAGLKCESRSAKVSNQNPSSASTGTASR